MKINLKLCVRSCSLAFGCMHTTYVHRIRRRTSSSNCRILNTTYTAIELRCIRNGFVVAVLKHQCKTSEIESVIENGRERKLKWVREFNPYSKYGNVLVLLNEALEHASSVVWTKKKKMRWNEKRSRYAVCVLLTAAGFEKRFTTPAKPFFQGNNQMNEHVQCE